MTNPNPYWYGYAQPQPEKRLSVAAIILLSLLGVFGLLVFLVGLICLLSDTSAGVAFISLGVLFSVPVLFYTTRSSVWLQLPFYLIAALFFIVGMANSKLKPPAVSSAAETGRGKFSATGPTTEESDADRQARAAKIFAAEQNLKDDIAKQKKFSESKAAKMKTYEDRFQPLIDRKVILRLEPENHAVRIEPFYWHALNIDEKKNVTALFANYFGIMDNLDRPTEAKVLSSRTDTLFSEFNEWSKQVTVYE